LMGLLRVLDVSALNSEEERGVFLLSEGEWQFSGLSSEVSCGMDGRPLRRNCVLRRKSDLQAESMETRKRRMKISMPTS